MKETLKYIGRWFIRFILIAIIFSTLQSCAKALTYDEILDYVTRTAAYFPNNSKYQIIKEQISSVAMENQISQYASNYESVYIYWTSGGTYQPAVVHCYMFTDSDGILTGNGQLYCSGTSCIINKAVNSSSTYNPTIRHRYSKHGRLL